MDLFETASRIRNQFAPVVILIGDRSQTLLYGQGDRTTLKCSSASLPIATPQPNHIKLKIGYGSPVQHP